MEASQAAELAGGRVWQGAGRVPGGHRPCLAGYRSPGLGRCPPPTLPVTAPCAPPSTSMHLATNTLISCCLQRARHSDERSSYGSRSAATRAARHVGTHTAVLLPTDPYPPFPPHTQPRYLLALSPAPQVTHLFQGAFQVEAVGDARTPHPSTGLTCQPTFQPTGSRIPGASSGRRPAPSTGPMLSANCFNPWGILLGETKALPSRHKLDRAQQVCPCCLEGQGLPCPWNWHSPPGTTGWGSLARQPGTRVGPGTG